ncbi:MAG TPA: hypothetical protein VNG93_09050 [Candidatus Dormibacteraeota bacterium]|nr:hypothetical protein [Candidatus Dormibacteraeota bacterium]
MPWAEIGQHGLALVVYPGLLAGCAVGLLLEIAAAWALVPGRGGLVPTARRVLLVLRPRRGGFPLYSALAGLLALVAASQLAAPFNPVPASDRNLLVAGIALIGSGWILWTWGWNREEVDPRLLLVVQLCWMVALLVPAIEPQTLKPQTLANIQLNPGLPLKVACGLLYLMCLPALLNLIPESAPQGVPGGAGRRAAGAEGAGFGALRLLLWLPYCGLFASLFFPPGGDDLVDLLRYLGLVAGTAAIAVAIALNLIVRGAAFTHRFVTLVVVPVAWITLGLGMLTAAIGTR